MKFNVTSTQTWRFSLRSKNITGVLKVLKIFKANGHENRTEY
jgi:hypothetical protein